MHGAGTAGANRGEEILRFEAVGDVIKLFAVTGEEDSAGAWTVAETDHITLDVFGAVGGRGEGLIVASVAGRCVGY